MSNIISKLDALREKWEARLRDRDPEAVSTVRALLRAWLYRRQDTVEEAVEALWDARESVWIGMYVAHYDRVHKRRRRLGDAFSEAHQAAHAAAVSRVRRAFFAALRKEWIEREDKRLRWMWAGGFQDLLEEIDGKGLELLLEGLLAIVNAAATRLPLLAVATDSLEELADARIESLLDEAIDGEPTPPTRREAVHAQPIRPRAPDAVLSETGTTIHDLLDEEPEVEQETDDDDDEAETVVAPDPATEAPTRAPFPEVEPVSSLRHKVERALHRHTPAGKVTERLKGIVNKDRASKAPDLDLSGLTLPGGES